MGDIKGARDLRNFHVDTYIGPSTLWVLFDGHQVLISEKEEDNGGMTKGKSLERSAAS